MNGACARRDVWQLPPTPTHTRPQLDAGLCEWPLVACVNGASLDGAPLEERLLREPHLLRVPREGELAVRAGAP